MNYHQKKVFINDFKKYVSELMHKHNNNGLYDLNYQCLNDYQSICDHNLKAYQAGVKINKALTAYIIEKYQIISDAYIYNIDPLTGCKL